jgi:glutamine synthetase
MIEMDKKRRSRLRKYQRFTRSYQPKKKLGDFPTLMEETMLRKISMLSQTLCRSLEEMEDSILTAKANGDHLAAARFYREIVFNKMSELRLVVDELETLIGSGYWVYPTYSDLLYSVN